jgi:putative transposase
LEDLKDVRQAKSTNAFKRYLNSWSHFRLKTLIDYKAKMYGIPVKYVDPAYTSQDCSKCDGRTKAKGKKYKCLSCNHHSHRDINASFNILDRI